MCGSKLHEGECDNENGGERLPRVEASSLSLDPRGWGHVVVITYFTSGVL